MAFAAEKLACRSPAPRAQWNSRLERPVATQMVVPKIGQIHLRKQDLLSPSEDSSSNCKPLAFSSAIPNFP